MPNAIYKPDTQKRQQILDEVREKVNTYESRMAYRLARWSEIAELYNGRTGTQRENSKFSSNSAELYKAVRAISNMQFRMLTGQRPFFELECLDVIGYTDPAKLLKAEHYITSILDASKFGKGLFKALVQLNLYGSVAVHTPYEQQRGSFLGKTRYITAFRPVSLISCAFSLDAMDIEDSGWIALTDIQSRNELGSLLLHDKDEKIYNHTEIKKAQKADYQPEVNTWVNQRMAYAGYMDGNFKDGMERTTYYGPLECLNDGEDYCVEIVNRQFIIRMESYTGLRPVRVATINNIDIEPLGSGLGDMFRTLLGQIDETRSALLNTITLAGANMFAKQKSLSEEDMDFSIRNFGILNLENPNIQAIGPNPQTIPSLAAYLQNQVQEFRQGSGATDTLQALVNDDQATATAVSLSMNEAVRNISVSSEQIAVPLVRDHVKMVLQNAQKYNTEPQVVNMGGAPVTLVPSDLLIDVDVRIKTTTDQDFRPAKIKNLMAAAQMMMGAGPNTIPGYKVNAGPTILEILKLLDVPNWNESISPMTEEDMLRMRLMSELGATGGQPTGEAEVEEPEEGVTTPAGQVLSAPGDQQASLQTTRQASVR